MKSETINFITNLYICLNTRLIPLIVRQQLKTSFSSSWFVSETQQKRSGICTPNFLNLELKVFATNLKHLSLYSKLEWLLKASSACEDTIRWIDANQLAEKCEYEYRLRELQSTCQPIMTKLHRQNASNSQQYSRGPKIEEVD